MPGLLVVERYGIRTGDPAAAISRTPDQVSRAVEHVRARRVEKVEFGRQADELDRALVRGVRAEQYR